VVDIVSLINPQARARRNALKALHAMQTRRAQTEEAQRAAAAAFEVRHQRRVEHVREDSQQRP
jgi:hypothetical protein